MYININLPPHLCSQVDAGRRMVAVQVEVHYDGRGESGEQLGPAEPQPAQETQHQQHRAVDGQERGRHHGVPAPVPHHPDDTGPQQQGKRQPVVVGDTPHLKTFVDNVNKWRANRFSR